MSEKSINTTGRPVFWSQNYEQSPAQESMLFNGLLNGLEDGTGDPLQNWDDTSLGAAVSMLKSVGCHSEEPQQAEKTGWPSWKSAKANAKISLRLREQSLAPGQAGDGLAGKQPGIKGHRGPGGQAECEPATHPCQEGQLHVGCQNRRSQQEMTIPVYPALARKHLENTV